MLPFSPRACHGDRHWSAAALPDFNSLPIELTFRTFECTTWYVEIFVSKSTYNLSDADMSGANLRYADLRKVNLTGTILRDSNLIGTNLAGANLATSDLKNAKLNGIRYCDTKMPWGEINEHCED